jgi:uncharacterized repeat protein (TIGR04138 family)
MFAYPFLRPYLPGKLRLAGPFLGTALFVAFLTGLVVELVGLLIDGAGLRRWRRLKRRIHRGLCLECGYDLRESARRCPECGADVIVPRLAVAVAENEGEDSEWRRRAGAAAGAAGCPVEAMVFVRRALWYADLMAGAVARGKGAGAEDEDEWAAHDVGAAELCRAVAAIAPASLGGRAAAVETLTGWGIRRGEDVGRIVDAMVESGLLQPSGRDTADDFAGAFDVERDV